MSIPTNYQHLLELATNPNSDVTIEVYEADTGSFHVDFSVGIESGADYLLLITADDSPNPILLKVAGKDLYTAATNSSCSPQLKLGVEKYLSNFGVIEGIEDIKVEVHKLPVCPIMTIGYSPVKKVAVMLHSETLDPEIEPSVIAKQREEALEAFDDKPLDTHFVAHRGGGASRIVDRPPNADAASAEAVDSRTPGHI